MQAFVDFVYIERLPPDITRQQCKRYFGFYGTVVQCLLLGPDVPMGQTASALIRFGSVEEATWVKDNLNGRIVGLDRIVVRCGRAALTGEGVVDFAGTQRSLSPTTADMDPPFLDYVFIDGLPAHMTLQECERIFWGYGTVVQCMLLGPQKNSEHKASALVRFGSVEEATWVVENLNGRDVVGLGEPIMVRCGMAALSGA